MEHLKGLLSLSALALALAPLSALAQGADPAAPAPVVGQPPAPADPATTATPAATPPTVAPTPDTGATSKPTEAHKPLIWRGTSFTWSQSVSTTTLGLGSDNIGHEEDTYVMDFVLAPQIYIVDLEMDKLFAFAEGGVSVELTDSGTTTTRNEPAFRDTQVGVGYNRTLWRSTDQEWSTGLALRTRYNIPTSKISLEQGRYGVYSLGASLTQKIRLLGDAADGLNNLSLTGGVTWSHLFSRSFNPTNPDLERTRQFASGTSRLDDQLSFRSFDIDRVIPALSVILPLYKDLSLTTQFRLIGRFRHDFEGSDCEVVVMGQCQKADRLDDRVTYLTDSTFDISLSQPIYEMFQLNLGYNNETLTLGEDGKTRNFLYSPSAVFYLDVVANIDAMYLKASGTEKIELPPGPRNNLPTATNEFGMPSF